jgi:hypothetical protein
MHCLHLPTLEEVVQQGFLYFIAPQLHNYEFTFSKADFFGYNSHVIFFKSN